MRIHLPQQRDVLVGSLKTFSGTVAGLCSVRPMWSPKGGFLVPILMNSRDRVQCGSVGFDEGVRVHD